MMINWQPQGNEEKRKGRGGTLQGVIKGLAPVGATIGENILLSTPGSVEHFSPKASEKLK